MADKKIEHIEVHSLNACPGGGLEVFNTKTGCVITDWNHCEGGEEGSEGIISQSSVFIKGEHWCPEKNEFVVINVPFNQQLLG